MKVKINKNIEYQDIKAGQIGYSDMVPRFGRNISYFWYYKVGILSDGVMNEFWIDKLYVDAVGEDDIPEAQEYVAKSIAQLTDHRMEIVKEIESNPCVIVALTPMGTAIGYSCFDWSKNPFINLQDLHKVGDSPFVKEYLEESKIPYIEFRKTMNSTVYKVRLINYPKKKTLREEDGESYPVRNYSAFLTKERSMDTISDLFYPERRTL